MDVLGLTSFDQIRGVLAVSPADLPDQTLTPLGIEDDLQDALSSWLPDWETVRDGDPGPALKLRLYAKYRCAATVAVAGQNFMFTQMTDGANGAQRSDREGYQLLREQLEARAKFYQDGLDEILNPVRQVERVAVMGVVNPARNPVTEAR